MDDASSPEFEQFVGDVVSLEEIEGERSGTRFEDLMGRITSVGRGEIVPSAALGGGLMVLGGALAALLPNPDSIRSSGFWRIGRSAGAQAMSIGDGAAGPMLIAGVALLIAGLLLCYRAGAAALVVPVVSIVGVAGLALVALLWIAVVLLWCANLALLVLIIFGYVVLTVVILGAVFGMLLGLSSR